MRRILFFIGVLFVSLAALSARADIGTTHQKLTLAGKVILENLPQGYILNQQSLNLRRSVGDILPTVISPFVRGEADMQFVEFIANKSGVRFHGFVYLVTDTNWSKVEVQYPSRKFQGKDPFTQESLIMYVSFDDGMNLRPLE